MSLAATHCVANSAVEVSAADRPTYLGAGNSFWFLDDAYRDGASQPSWNQSQGSSYAPSHTINYYASGRGTPGYAATAETTWTGGYDQGLATGSFHDATQLAWGGYGVGHCSTVPDHLGQEVSWYQDAAGLSYGTGYYPTTTADFRGFSGGSDVDAPNWTPWADPSRSVSPWHGCISPWMMQRWYQHPTSDVLPSYIGQYVKQEREDCDVVEPSCRPSTVSTPLAYQQSQGKNETASLPEIPSTYNHRTLQPYNHTQLRDLLLTARAAPTPSAEMETETTTSSGIPPPLDVTAVTSHPAVTSPVGVASMGVANLKVKLCNAKLWRQFHACTNEMIITKAGRRIFPTLQFSLEGLDKNRFYTVCVDMLQLGNSQWKYQSSRWMPSGKAQPPLPKRVCLHPESPQSGEFWTSRDVIFSKLKLTNSKTCCDSSTIILHSMHRYQPRVHVIEISSTNDVTQRTVHTHAFPETQFVAVTAYQNTDITQLKIDHNPFAKGFRDSQECCGLFGGGAGVFQTTHDDWCNSHIPQVNDRSSTVTSSTWKSSQTAMSHWPLNDNDADVFTSSPEQTVPNPGQPATYFSAV